MASRRPTHKRGAPRNRYWQALERMSYREFSQHPNNAHRGLRRASADQERQCFDALSFPNTGASTSAGVVPRSSSDNGFVYARARDRYNHPNATYRLDAVPDAAARLVIWIRLSRYPTSVAPYGIGRLRFRCRRSTTALRGLEILPQLRHSERANNEKPISTSPSHDDRYVLAMTVSGHDPKSAAEDIRRFGKMPGVVGVQLLILQEMAGSQLFDPIYEAACEMGLAIVIHQNGGEGCYTYSQGPAGGIPRSYAERHAVLPQVGAANVMDMIVSGALERFPQLRVVMVEWGFTWLSWLLSRMDYLWESDRSAAPLVKRRPSEYVAEHFTFATQPLDETTKMPELAAMFGIQNLDKMLLFSSDYPHYDTDSPSVILGKIPDALKARVCYQNAVVSPRSQNPQIDEEK